MTKIYGGFRLNSEAWKTLKTFKQQGQDYTKTIEEALGQYKLVKEVEQGRLNAEKQRCLNKNSDKEGVLIEN